MNEMILTLHAGLSGCAAMWSKFSRPHIDEHCVRVEFFGDEIDRIREVDALTGEIIGEREHIAIFPASHFVTHEDKMKVAIQNIEKELEERLDRIA